MPPRQDARKQRQREVDGRGQAGKREPDNHRRHATDQNLSFGTNVEHARPKPERHPKTGQDQRCSGSQRFGTAYPVVP